MSYQYAVNVYRIKTERSGDETSNQLGSLVCQSEREAEQLADVINLGAHKIYQSNGLPSGIHAAVERWTRI